MTGPVGLLRGLRQPDRRSCGASVVVAARMLAEPSYADSMTPERFADEALVAHRRITARAVAGVPWPRALGTPPWAVARELGALVPPGSPAARYVTRLAWPDPGARFDRAAATVRAGHPVAFYVGNRWCPRHVVLAVGAAEADGLLVYEPGSGQVRPLDRRSVVERRIRLAGWDRLWFVVHTR